MLGKLMKLELRGMIWDFLPVWAIALVLSVLNFFFGFGNIHTLISQSESRAVAAALLMLGTMILLVVLAVASFAAICTRFARSMYGPEAYLTHTLPVTVDQLLISKGLCAMLVLTVTILMGILLCLSTVGEVLKASFTEVLSSLESYKDLIGSFAGFGFKMLLLGLVSMTAGVMMVYAAIALGQLWVSQPVAGGIIAFVLLSGVSNFLTERLFSPLFRNVLEEPQWVTEISELTISAITWGEALASLVMLVLCYGIARYLLTRKLNLQ